MSKKVAQRVVVINKIKEEVEEVLEDNEKRIYVESTSEETERLIESGEIDSNNGRFQYLIKNPKDSNEFPRVLESIELYRYLTPIKVYKATVISYLGKIKRGQKTVQCILELEKLPLVNYNVLKDRTA